MPTPPSAGPYAISKIVRTAMITAFRAAFATDSKYQYKSLPDTRTDFDNTLIEITDVQPISPIKVPTVVISGLGFSSGSIYFEDDLVREVRDEDGHVTGEIHGGRLNLTITAEVWAWDSLEREEITDQCYIYLKTLKDVTSNFGIEIRQISLIPPREEVLGSRVQFVSGLSFDTYSEWSVTNTISPSELISKFAVSVQTALVSINLNQ